MLRRHLLFGVAILLGAMLLAGRSPAYVFPLYACFLLLGVPFFAVTSLGTDRADGTLEFLCGLPVRGRQLALGRLLALLEGCALTGLFTAAGIMIFLANRLGPWPVLSSALAGFIGASLLMLASGAFLLWLALRFRPETVAAVLPLGLLAVVFILRPFAPSLSGMWSGFLALEGWLLPILGGVAALSALHALLSFHLLSRAFDRCVHDPSRARVSSR